VSMCITGKGKLLRSEGLGGEMPQDTPNPCRPRRASTGRSHSATTSAREHGVGFEQVEMIGHKGRYGWFRFLIMVFRLNIL